MLSVQEKKACLEIMTILTKADLISLAKTATGETFDEVTLNGAFCSIIDGTLSLQEFLNRTKITQKVLIKYMKSKLFPFDEKATKEKLVEQVIGIVDQKKLPVQEVYAEILMLLTVKDRLSLAKTVTGKTFNETTMKGAFESILDVTWSFREFLNRSKITQNVLIKYLIEKSFHFDENATKEKLVEQIIDVVRMIPATAPPQATKEVQTIQIKKECSQDPTFSGSSPQPKHPPETTIIHAVNVNYIYEHKNDGPS